MEETSPVNYWLRCFLGVVILFVLAAVGASGHLTTSQNIPINVKLSVAATAKNGRTQINQVGSKPRLLEALRTATIPATLIFGSAGRRMDRQWINMPADSDAITG